MLHGWDRCEAQAIEVLYLRWRLSILKRCKYSLAKERGQDKRSISANTFTNSNVRKLFDSIHLQLCSAAGAKIDPDTEDRADRLTHKYYQCWVLPWSHRSTKESICVWWEWWFCCRFLEGRDELSFSKNFTGLVERLFCGFGLRIIFYSSQMFSVPHTVWTSPKIHYRSSEVMILLTRLTAVVSSVLFFLLSCVLPKRSILALSGAQILHR